MFFPEFTITQKVLKNIGFIEYYRAIIENTVILQNWENQLKKEAKIAFIYSTLQEQGINVHYDAVKRSLDNMEKNVPAEIVNLDNTYNSLSEIARGQELDEVDIKFLHKELCQNLIPKMKLGVYRNNKVQGKPMPEQILADVVELFDWFNSLDAKEIHPIVTAAILKARLETIMPFDNFNSVTIDYLIQLVFKITGYAFKDYVTVPAYYQKTKSEMKSALTTATDEMDFTDWIEYFTEGVALQVSSVQEKVKTLAKDTKIAKASGRYKLSERQEKIIEFIQNYGMLQNKDFSKVFPNISEDSVLRDLKVLIEKGIIEKNGSTKSSRYELK
ncbi:hypothetical protein A2619_01960 [candidate division WWE3 bacterium RIFOXYD1_FULL_39_9]|uniref:Fido domain-containing protein n=1 Tax=candidate division WWE3 bacterium RIFOXYD1_FULL_39_9 TaxID=1802649 RepID=A0A1F4X7A4_UNCKA|nr:MAG: hypothetical protein A2619_01960 [candidate division WWE3 bacterium RIFOXYD1_FULL_39_9]